MRRFFSGLLLVAGGALIAVGVYPNWATLGASERALNGFTMGSTQIDAVVSFAAGGLLMLMGLLVVLRGGLASRTLGFMVSILAIMWAALIVFMLSSFKHDIDHLVPALSFARDLQIGYFLTAGGAVIAFLGGLIGMSVRSRAKVVSRTAMTQPARPDATVPRTATAPMRPPASLWTPDNSGRATPVDSRTPTEVGSGR
jgi:uncharacterized membrane protein